MAEIRWDLLANLGKTFTDSYDAGRKRRREDEADAMFGELAANVAGGGQGASAAPATTIASLGTAPSASAAPSFAGGSAGPRRMAMPADPEIERRVLDTARAGGLTNPFALATLGAFGQAESGFSPKNVMGSWSDPSERGAAGTSGGVLSWRNERFANMRAQAGAAKDPHSAAELQTKFFLTENPELTVALQNAKSVEEAHDLMSRAWRYAGYDRPGTGEHAKRLDGARGYLKKLGPPAEASATVQADLPVEKGAAAQFQVPGQDPGASAVPSGDAQTRMLVARMLRNPETRTAGLTMLQQLRKDDAWQIADVGGNKVWANPRTRQIVPIPGGDAQKPTSDLQEYEYYRRQAIEAGEKPDSYTAWMRSNKAASKPETTINNTVNPILKGVGDRFNEAMDRAQASARQIAGIHEARRAIDSGAITGPGADLRLAATKIAGLFGLPAGTAENTEVLRSAIGTQVLEQAKTLGANPTNEDRRVIAEIVGGKLSLEEGTVRRLLDMQERWARESIKRANAMGSSLLTAQPEELKNVAPMLSMAEPPSYDEFVKANPAPKAAAPAAQAQEKPQMVSTFAAVPEGKRFRGPDGKVYRKVNGKAVAE